MHKHPFFFALFLSSAVTGSAHFAHAQDGRLVPPGTAIKAQGGVTWAPQGDGGDDSVLCDPNPTKIRHRAKSAGTIAKSAKPHATGLRKPKLPNGNPRMMCPRVVTGPRLLGTPAAQDVSAVPIGASDMVVDEMPMVSDVADVNGPAPVIFSSADGGHSFRPFGWALGGGLAIPFLFFSHSHHSSDSGGLPVPRSYPIPSSQPDPLTPPGPPPVTSTPEPSTIALVATGLAAIAGSRRRRKRR